MRKRIGFAMTLAGAVLCVLPNVAVAQSGPIGSQSGGLAPIEGTWFITVEGAPSGTFWSLMSFTAGGVTVATGTSDRTAFGPAPISPLYGSLSLKGDGSYVVTILFFTFNLDGTPAALFKTNETLWLMDDNTLKGTGVGSICSYQLPPTIKNCTSLVGPPITIYGSRIIAQGAAN